MVALGKAAPPQEPGAQEIRAKKGVHPLIEERLDLEHPARPHGFIQDLQDRRMELSPGSHTGPVRQDGRGGKDRPQEEDQRHAKQGQGHQPQGIHRPPLDGERRGISRAVDRERGELRVENGRPRLDLAEAPIVRKHPEDHDDRSYEERKREQKNPSRPAREEIHEPGAHNNHPKRDHPQPLKLGEVLGHEADAVEITGGHCISWRRPVCHTD